MTLSSVSASSGVGATASMTMPSSCDVVAACTGSVGPITRVFAVDVEDDRAANRVVHHRLTCLRTACRISSILAMKIGSRVPAMLTERKPAFRAPSNFTR